MQKYSLVAKMQIQHKKTKAIIKSLCQYSTNTRSEITLSIRENELFKCSTKDQITLRNIFSNLETSDMVSVRIPDFLELLKVYKVRDDRTKQLEVEMTVQQMVILNQQNLLEDSQLVAFFKNIESTDILAQFKKEDLVLDTKYKRPRILACFREIP